VSAGNGKYLRCKAGNRGCWAKRRDAHRGAQERAKLNGSHIKEGKLQSPGGGRDHRRTKLGVIGCRGLIQGRKQTTTYCRERGKQFIHGKKKKEPGFDGGWGGTKPWELKRKVNGERREVRKKKKFGCKRLLGPCTHLGTQRGKSAPELGPNKKTKLRII